MFKKTLHPLLPKEIDFGKRRKTFRRTLGLLEERKAKILLETGTARNGLSSSRSDGASTIVFAAWAQKHDAELISIDYDMDAIAIAKREVLSLGLEDSVEFVNAESSAYLNSFSQKVDFLYLDSYDYDKRNKEEQKKSQEHHLLEFRSIQSQLHEDSVILIDDCKLPGGGKGKLVIEELVKKGWRVVTNAYQCLLVKG